MVALDSLDRALIAALRVNGRAPVAELARDLGVTRTTIARRIQALEDEGVILGFSVLLRNDAADPYIRAISHLAIEGPHVEAAIEVLRGMPQITALHATNGEWDLIAELSVETLADVDLTLAYIRRIEGITRSETHLLLRSVLI
ncbi:Lrp/AsnC family transcriptional regulator [Buchananella hordeovulneris]|uniref:Lrp/AsnC family transcriptional regulator n=1 Tax=Buchananella hordeovulneris TaxID=52770 RepID=UPI0026DD0D7C|nr:Lrp/AsnC family transcriptional regulator [Buchananella hordeovulneris]MDO5080681.1 Lrp/AsnC family transcriptional regulator [Buchananella hordeovulneris]